MKNMHSIVWKENNWYVAKALEVEITSQGKSEDEALDNLKEALELYFEEEDIPNQLRVEKPKLHDLAIHIHA